MTSRIRWNRTRSPISFRRAEVFDSGDINLALALLKQGVLKSPPLFQIVTGIQYGFAGNPDALFYARSMLPPDAQWAAFGIGRMAFPMVAQAYLLGGHVRVDWRT